MAIPRTGFGGGLGYALINQRKKKTTNPFAGMIRSPFADPNSGRGPATFYGNQLFGGGAPQSQGNPYADLINNLMNQQMADISAESVADAASRDAAIRRFLVSYGEIPDFDSLGISGQTRGFLDKALDPRTRELAAKNTAEGTSIKARLEHANALAQRRIPAQLAARGLLRSGQTGADLSEQQLGHKTTIFDTLNELLGGIEGTVGQFVNSERERQRALAQAQMEAAMLAMQEWGGMVGNYFDAASPSTSVAPNQSKTSQTRKISWRPAPRGGSGGGPFRSQ